MKLLTVCGSLRAASSNAEVLSAAALLATAGVAVTPFGGIAALPPFSPDAEADAPASVRAWQAALASAYGMLICSPEYAHGIPGALKNALDWVVGSGELCGKPVALLNSAPRATHAQAQLREVLTTMDALVVGVWVVPISDKRAGASAIAANPSSAGPIRQAIMAVCGQDAEPGAAADSRGRTGS